MVLNPKWNALQVLSVCPPVEGPDSDSEVDNCNKLRIDHVNGARIGAEMLSISLGSAESDFMLIQRKFAEEYHE